MARFVAAFAALDVDAMVGTLEPDARLEVAGLVTLEGRDSIRFFLDHLRTALVDVKIDVAGESFTLAGTVVDGSRFQAKAKLVVEERGGRVRSVRIDGDPEKWNDLLERAQRFATRLDFQMD